MMELSDLTNKLIVDKNRVNLYFDKYKYKTVLCIPLIHYFRNVTNIKKYQCRLNDTLHVWTSNNTLTRVAKTLQEILLAGSPTNVKKFEKIISWLEYVKPTTDIKIVTKYDFLEIYNNDLTQISDLLDRLSQFNLKEKLYYAEKLNHYTKDTIYHKNPKFKTRIYFKLKRFDDAETDNFTKFVESYNFNLSPSLTNLLYRSHLYRSFRVPQIKKVIMEHFYVDINDDYLLTVLSLTYPDLIRKVCKIEKR